MPARASGSGFDDAVSGAIALTSLDSDRADSDAFEGLQLVITNSFLVGRIDLGQRFLQSALQRLEEAKAAALWLEVSKICQASKSDFLLPKSRQADFQGPGPEEIRILGQNVGGRIAQFVEAVT